MPNVIKYNNNTNTVIATAGRQKIPTISGMNKPIIKPNGTKCRRERERISPV